MNDALAEQGSSEPQTLSVSIAIATYNGEKYLLEQLESLASQTLSPLELVITDDGSTDATLAIVETFARTAPFPIRCFRNEKRLGYADNFLYAASLCKGDLIAFCDQDDIWFPSKLQTCERFFADPQVLLTEHSARTLLPSGMYGSRYPDLRRTQVLPSGTCDPFTNRPGFTVMVRKELLLLADNTDRLDVLYSHDHWVGFLAANAGKTVTLSEVLCLYRQHAANVFGVPKRKPFAQWFGERARVPEYEAIATTEFACASMLSKITKSCPADLVAAIAESAARFTVRATLHQTRGQMYGEGATLRVRAGIFRRLLVSGAYRNDSSRTYLGVKAAFKDLCLGVTGVSSLCRASARMFHSGRRDVHAELKCSTEPSRQRRQ